MTICPAIVAVRVAFCPEASSASAKSVPASPTPSIGASSACASWISAMSVRPLWWKTAAAVMRIDALIAIARTSATVESIVANRIAVGFAAARAIRGRVRTSEEWR